MPCGNLIFGSAPDWIKKIMYEVKREALKDTPNFIPIQHKICNICNVTAILLELCYTVDMNITRMNCTLWVKIIWVIFTIFGKNDFFPSILTLYIFRTKFQYSHIWSYLELKKCEESLKSFRIFKNPLCIYVYMYIRLQMYAAKWGKERKIEDT